MIVYTTNFGNIGDKLRDPLVRSKGVKYICFADKTIKSKIWKIKKVRVSDPVLATRLYKLRPMRYFKGPTLWMDCSFELKVDPRSLLRLLKGVDMVAFKHPHRHHILQEAAVLATRLKLPLKHLRKQVVKYLGDGFKQRQVTVPNFCIRSANDKMEDFGNMWWKQYLAYPHGRDQMSIDYSMWVMGIKVKYIPGH